jgi:YD repeat-containing protein
LKSQHNAKGQATTIDYHPDDRPNTKIQTVEGTITYNYNSNKQLTSIVSPPSNTIKRRFVYDTKGRVTSMIDSIPGTSKFLTGFSYDTKGRLSTITHPSGIVETKNYNTFGYLSSINAGGAVRWTTTGMNALLFLNLKKIECSESTIRIYAAIKSLNIKQNNKDLTPGLCGQFEPAK